jgi:hypothetical protein
VLPTPGIFFDAGRLLERCDTEQKPGVEENAGLLSAIRVSWT